MIKGSKNSDETKKKISEALKGKNHPFYGKQHSNETKKRISKTMVGKTREKGNN